MSSGFLLYGSTGFVGDAIARLAVQRGLRPVIAGRNAARVKAQAAELGLECWVFNLDDSAALDEALAEVVVVLHCAGPYMHTYKPMVEACLRTGSHYLDLTGELPVLEALAARDAEAKTRKVMLLPAVGFDVAPTDCLALHLKQRLPSPNRLTLAFHIQGPARLPPGTIATISGLMPSIGGVSVVRDGCLEMVPVRMKTRLIDFGQGPVKAMLMPWVGDVYMAFRSTGIPNIEEYPVHSVVGCQQLMMIFVMSPLLRLAAFRRFFESRKRGIPLPTSAPGRAPAFGEKWKTREDKEPCRGCTVRRPRSPGLRWRRCPPWGESCRVRLLPVFRRRLWPMVLISSWNARASRAKTSTESWRGLAAAPTLIELRGR